ncbi:MAG: M23 family metallopeptidase [Candidatus Ozemobacteraceae bacterium]
MSTPAPDYYTQHPGEPFHSTTLQEYSPVQTTGDIFPNQVTWSAKEAPTAWIYLAPFVGKPGQKASHEGLDFVHNKSAVPHVPVIAVAEGTVAYVRTGCPQSSLFSSNTSLREAGAGWGNHVVLYHGNGIYTRYAHLIPGTIKAKPGERVIPGDILGEMGNSGRSDVRHLHFEIGFKNSPFVSDKPAQSFDLVFDPKRYLP